MSIYNPIQLGALFLTPVSIDNDHVSVELRSAEGCDRTYAYEGGVAVQVPAEVWESAQVEAAQAGLICPTSRKFANQKEGES